MWKAFTYSNIFWLIQRFRKKKSKQTHPPTVADTNSTQQVENIAKLDCPGFFEFSIVTIYGTKKKLCNTAIIQMIDIQKKKTHMIHKYPV